MITNFSIPQKPIQAEDVCLCAEKPGAVCDSVTLVLNGGIASKVHENAFSGDFERLKRRFDLQAESRRLLPSEAVSSCLRWRFDLTRGIGVHYASAKKSAFYSNLQTCGLPWVCPVCAAKITERRRLELGQAVDKWRGQGNTVVLATFTLKHSADDSLPDLLDAMNGAFRKLKAGRRWQAVEKDFRIAGSVTGHEITYGQSSGFHPHKHVLLFCSGEITYIEQYMLWWNLITRWQAVLSDYGRTASDLHGVDVQIGYGAVSDYVAKWGVVEEVTKANSKAGHIQHDKTQHFSPFQLLDLTLSGSVWAEDVFREYASATKGKNQLTWSKGLRDILDLGSELSDIEILEIQEEKAVKLLTLGWPSWRKVLKNNARAMVLEVAKTGDVNFLRVYLSSLGVEEGGD